MNWTSLYRTLVLHLLTLPVLLPPSVPQLWIDDVTDTRPAHLVLLSKGLDGGTGFPPPLDEFLNEG